MRTLIATVFNSSLDGLLADEGTEFWKFCFSLPENREPDDPAHLDFLQSAYAHIMGRTAYEGIARAMTTSTGHPFAPLLNGARKVVFSRTLKTADWANTTIAAGDTAEEIDNLRQGGDGHIVVWGGVSLWRSLMRLDLIDELQVTLFPYVAGEGTRLFDGVPRSYQLDLVSSTATSNGIIQLRHEEDLRRLVRVRGAAHVRSSTAPGPAGKRSAGCSGPRDADRRSRSARPATGTWH